MVSRIIFLSVNEFIFDKTNLVRSNLEIEICLTTVPTDECKCFQKCGPFWWSEAYVFRFVHSACKLAYECFIWPLYVYVYEYIWAAAIRVYHTVKLNVNQEISISQSYSSSVRNMNIISLTCSNSSTSSLHRASRMFHVNAFQARRISGRSEYTWALLLLYHNPPGRWRTLLTENRYLNGGWHCTENTKIRGSSMCTNRSRYILVLGILEVLLAITISLHYNRIISFFFHMPYCTLSF